MKPLPLEAVVGARRRRGLVAIFDLDGTLAPIAPRPAAARIPPPVRRALARLARRPDTTVGVVSGRPIAEVRRILSRLADGSVYLAGIHGYERRPPGGPVHRLWTAVDAREATDVVRRIARALRGLSGWTLERKGPVVAVHVRAADPAERRRALVLVRGLCARGARVAEGRRVVEIRPVAGPTKADAVRWIATTRAGATLLYAGDDATDEDAFRAVGRRGFAVLVGGGAARRERSTPPPGKSRTAARFRLAGPAAVGRLIERLAEAP